MIQIFDKQFDIFITEDEIAKEISSLARQINENYAGQEVIFISVLNGAFMFSSDLLKEITIPCEISFIKMQSYDGVSTSGKVTELIGLNSDLENKNIIILEDIVDTGLTIDKIIDLLKGKNCKSIKICTLLYKPEAFQGENIPDYIGFSIPNNFVVGYGMDYNERGRNLKELYKIIE